MALATEAVTSSFLAKLLGGDMVDVIGDEPFVLGSSGGRNESSPGCHKIFELCARHGSVNWTVLDIFNNPNDCFI